MAVRSRALIRSRPRRPPTVTEVMDELDTLELRIRAIASRWHNHVPAAVRKELHDAATPATDVLIRAGRRSRT